MPSTKVFAAVLAALAVPMVNASPCKPKAPTTTDTALPGLTTSETVTALTSGTATGTATTESSPATTTVAACSQYTPFEEQPAECGKTGTAPNCADKIIGTPSTCVDWKECGNTCGKTLGCKSFSVQGSTCTLYDTLIEELGFTPGLGSSRFYDLELCFTCAEESSATSGTETATGTQTTETGIETATGTQTTETAAGTQTTETDIDTATGAQTTATSGTETASGTQTTETTAETGAGIQTTETSAAANTDTTETTTSTETISESISESGTTTAAATTTTEAACAAYTLKVDAPTTCGKFGKPASNVDYDILGEDIVGNAYANDCAIKCADLRIELDPEARCLSFSFKDGVCKFYNTPVSVLHIEQCSITDGAHFYDFSDCYSCHEDAAPTTTETAAETGTTSTEVIAESDTTTAAAATTTTETSSEALTTTTGAATTTTEAAITSSTEAVATSSTEAAITSSTEAADTTTTEAATTTTEAAIIATTTEAATTTTEAAPVCTNYIPKPNRPSTCGQEGRVACSDSEKLGPSFYAYNADKCGKVCGTTEGCKTFSFKKSTSKCQLYKSALESLQFRPCTTGVKFYDLEKCYTCQNEETPAPPATCAKYVPNFASCSQGTHCGTPGSICEEERIPNAGDASCLENCAKSCISFGTECKYFSYKPASNRFSAKCDLYKSGKITKNSRYSTKFYEQPCFKCQGPTST
ncbi:unnamed protein product [Fusarium equiseti]|uniref:Apple domain-containing protein n=1 Tax=Fusarium equiseti TaxID=61235 RepID=A0A8J2ISK0_FUSEQ|nr:unnamed protein product [Fusarium equiseti]